MKPIQFKILQRRLKFRNPNHLLGIPADLSFSRQEESEARRYVESLSEKNINFTYPGHFLYPEAFIRMKEPPLFLEYKGNAIWQSHEFVSVVGSRQISVLTQAWMKNHLPGFLKQTDTGIVSGGARGVDQLSHLLALKNKRPSLFVLPSGVEEMYPPNLKQFEIFEFQHQACFLSEFESHQKINKSHFYFRNRLIAAMGRFTLVTQASLRSGSLLTVHHCLENGRLVTVVSAHPECLGFDGNLKLMREGATVIYDEQDLLENWKAESAR